MWWIVDRDQKGEPLLFGPYTMAIKAQNYADDNCSSGAELFELDTVNSAKATSMLKEKLVDRFHDVGKGMKRFRHPRKRM